MEGNRTLADIKKVFDKYKVNRDELLRFDLKKDGGKIDKETGALLLNVKATQDLIDKKELLANQEINNHVQGYKRAEENRKIAADDLDDAAEKIVAEIK